MRARLLITAAGAAVLAGAAPAGPAAGAPDAGCANARPALTVASAIATRAAVLCALNDARAARGLDPLREDPRLRRAAQGYADRLGVVGPLVHDAGGSVPERRIAATGYGRGDVARFDFAEAIGRGFGASAAPHKRVDDWMGDTTTRRLLLARRFRDAGVGVRSGGGTTTYVVEVAVSSAAAAASPAPR